MPDLAMNPAALHSLRGHIAETAETLAESPPGAGPARGAYGAGFDEAHHIGDLADRTAAAADRLLRTLENQVRAMEITLRMATDATQRADEDNREELARLLAAMIGTSAPANPTPATAFPRDVS